MLEFTESIDQNWPDYVISPGASPGCHDCFSWAENPDNPTKHESVCADEGSFSWSECESCGSTLGGQRYPAHAIHKEAFGPDAKQPDNVYHIEICADCLCFHANGDEPEIWE